MHGKTKLSKNSKTALFEIEAEVSNFGWPTYTPIMAQQAIVSFQRRRV
jgi:hypothetical protein